MNEGVKILLDRMKTHPEEFIGGNRRWEYLIETHRVHMPAEDARALDDGLAQLYGQVFTEKVLEELVEEGKYIKKERWQRDTLTGGLTPSPSLYQQAYAQQASSNLQNSTASQGLLSSLGNLFGGSR